MLFNSGTTTPSHSGSHCKCCPIPLGRCVLRPARPFHAVHGNLRLHQGVDYSRRVARPDSIPCALLGRGASAAWPASVCPSASACPRLRPARLPARPPACLPPHSHDPPAPDWPVSACVRVCVTVAIGAKKGRQVRRRLGTAARARALRAMSVSVCADSAQTPYARSTPGLTCGYRRRRSARIGFACRPAQSGRSLENASLVIVIVALYDPSNNQTHKLTRTIVSSLLITPIGETLDLRSLASERSKSSPGRQVARRSKPRAFVPLRDSTSANLSSILDTAPYPSETPICPSSTYN